MPTQLFNVLQNVDFWKMVPKVTKTKSWTKGSQWNSTIAHLTIMQKYEIYIQINYQWIYISIKIMQQFL